SPDTANLAMLIFALDPPSTYHSVLVLSESTFAFTIVVAYFLAWRASRKGSAPFAAAAGLALGAAVLIRPIALYVLPLAALFVAHATHGAVARRVALGAVVLAVGLVPPCAWMARNARHLKGELQRGVASALERGGAAWGLFLLVFFAVVREGVELALLLFAAPGEGKLLGAMAGLSLAAGVGLLIYVFGRRIDLRTFFKVTTVMLVLFAAGLVSHAAHEFAEAGVLAAVEGPKLWSTKTLLPDGEGLGAIVRALFGYQDEPTVIEAVAYVGYFVVAWLLSRTDLARAPIVAPREAAAP
ncbi:MAG: FTR1 family protein, partial [Chloroflexota bacterium]